MMPQPYEHAGTEPPLAEVLDDPIVRLTMQRDGVTTADLCRVIVEGRARLGLEGYVALVSSARLCAPAAAAYLPTRIRRWA